MDSGFHGWPLKVCKSLEKGKAIPEPFADRSDSVGFGLCAARYLGQKSAACMVQHMSGARLVMHPRKPKSGFHVALMALTFELNPPQIIVNFNENSF